MKEKITNEDIRRLIARWYEATLSPSEENLLREALEDDREWPADLEADRQLILSLNGGEEADIPEHLSLRINDALEKEIGRSRAFRRPIWWAAAGVAVALFGVFITPRLMDVEEIHEQELAANAEKHQMMISKDTVRLAHSLLSTPDNTPDYSEVNREKPVKQEKASVSNSAPVSSASISSIHAGRTPIEDRAGRKEEREEWKSSNKESYLSYSEEQQLADRNYHVVSDSREAEKILSSIFSRIDDNIEVERAKLSHINTEYENQVSKATSEVSSLNNRNHEAQPL